MKTKTELPTEREESMRVIEAQGATPQMESSRHRPAIFDEAVKTLKAKEPLTGRARRSRTQGTEKRNAESREQGTATEREAGQGKRRRESWNSYRARHRSTATTEHTRGAAQHKGAQPTT